MFSFINWQISKMKAWTGVSFGNIAQIPETPEGYLQLLAYCKDFLRVCKRLKARAVEKRDGLARAYKPGQFQPTPFDDTVNELERLTETELPLICKVLGNCTIEWIEDVVPMVETLQSLVKYRIEFEKTSDQRVVQRHLDDAERFIKNGDFASAKGVLQNFVLKNNPDHAVANHLLEVILLTQLKQQEGVLQAVA